VRRVIYGTTPRERLEIESTGRPTCYHLRRIRVPDELTYDSFIQHLTESEESWRELAHRSSSATATQMVKFHRQLLIALVEMRELVGHFARYPGKNRYVRIDIRPHFHKLTRAFADIKLLEEKMGPSSPLETAGSIQAIAGEAIDAFAEIWVGEVVSLKEAKEKAIKRVCEGSDD